MKCSIFVALPTYGGEVKNTLALANMLTNGEEGNRLSMKMYATSLLTYGFNLAWVDALNLKAEGKITHFLMLHNDVQPTTPNWLVTLVKTMEETQADVLSAIVPIKDSDANTSTAIDDGDSIWRPNRITVKEALERPETWTDPKLLINTGCLLVNMAKPWVAQICFQINNAIEFVDGRWVAHVESEDWNFSRQCHKLGVKLFATRVVPVVHWDGRTAYGLNYGIRN